MVIHNFSLRTVIVQKRYTPIFVFTALLAVVACVGYFMDEPTPKVPERILLDNAAGKVVFNHAKHLKDDNIPCATCHHEMVTEKENVQSCGTCHGVTFNESFKATHAKTIQGADSCASCHHMEFEPKVKWDHAAHVDDYELDCYSCHHDDTNIEPEPQNCANCHESTGDEAMPSLRIAVHTKCQSCHGDMYEEKVAGCASCHTPIESRKLLQEKGPADFKVNPLYANCATCHVDQKNQELVPDRMSAFHGQCITCHEKIDKGPYTKDQCNQCHTK